jgi:hypothetical protein
MRSSAQDVAEHPVSYAQDMPTLDRCFCTAFVGNMTCYTKNDAKMFSGNMMMSAIMYTTVGVAVYLLEHNYV